MSDNCKAAVIRNGGCYNQQLNTAYYGGEATTKTVSLARTGNQIISLRPESIKEAKKMIREYINHYNYIRGHQALNYITPYLLNSSQKYIAA